MVFILVNLINYGVTASKKKKERQADREGTKEKEKRQKGTNQVVSKCVMNHIFLSKKTAPVLSPHYGQMAITQCVETLIPRT